MCPMMICLAIRYAAFRESEARIQQIGSRLRAEGRLRG
jgi:hypothetical protein